MYNFKGDMKWLMQCAGKTKHASQNSAQFAAQFAVELYGNTPKEPYLCKYCNHWHLGTSTKKEKKK